MKDFVDDPKALLAKCHEYVRISYQQIETEILDTKELVRTLIITPALAEKLPNYITQCEKQLGKTYDNTKIEKMALAFETNGNINNSEILLSLNEELSTLMYTNAEKKDMASYQYM